MLSEAQVSNALFESPAKKLPVKDFEAAVNAIMIAQGVARTHEMVGAPTPVPLREPEFWMVFLEGGRCPAFKHKTEQSAKDEAQRLALLHGQNAYVLEERGHWAPTRTVEWRTDDIPF